MGVTVTLTAPDTAQQVTVLGGGTKITFDVLAPTDVRMDRHPNTGVRHTHNRPDCGIATDVYLLPDTVNFLNVIYHETNVVPAATGHYSCLSAYGHCRKEPGGVCDPLYMTDKVVAGYGTLADLPDCVYSGHCGGAAPFVPGAITHLIGYEYRVGTGPFYYFRSVLQESRLAADGVTMTSSKAGASGHTKVADPTVAIPNCLPGR